jgi:hypothetical protein
MLAAEISFQAAKFQIVTIKISFQALLFPNNRATKKILVKEFKIV